MKKILVVDDSPDWINAHTFALKYHLGKKVKIDSANSAKQGYQRVSHNLLEPYDIVIVDMEMEDAFIPLYAGEWLIKQIQALSEYARIRIFIVSSVVEIDEIAQKYGVSRLPKDKCENIMEYKIFAECF
jgi:CheY-like chemotaxis protein